MNCAWCCGPIPTREIPFVGIGGEMGEPMILAEAKEVFPEPPEPFYPGDPPPPRTLVCLPCYEKLYRKKPNFP